MASVDSFETDIRKLRRKRRRKRAVKNIMSIFMVCAFVLLIYASSRYWLPFFEGILEREIRIMSNGELEQSENYPLDISKKSNVDIHIMGDCWTLYADTSFQTRQPDGTIISTHSVPYSNPIIETVSKRTLIYDLGGYEFSVYGRKNVVFSKKLNDQILFCEIGEKGNVAVVTETDKYPAFLTIYDKNGIEIYRWANSNLITSVALNPSGDGCVVASSYALGGSIKSVVTYLDFGKTQPLAKSLPMESMILQMKFNNKGDIWAIGDNALYRLNDRCKLDYTYNYSYDLEKFASNGESVVLTFKKVGTKQTIMAIVDSDTDSPVERSFFDDIKHVEVIGSTVYYITKKSLNTLDKSGSDVGSFALDAEYLSFVVQSDSVLMRGAYTIDKINFGSSD